jgi:hypothetical protein
MFDLDNQIRAWRAAVADTFANRPDCLDELEAHLRDEFDRLTAAGSPPADAWQAALNALGNPKALATEFGKLAPSPRWLPIWIAAIALAIFILILAVVATRLRPLLAAHVLTFATGYAACFAIGFLAICAILTRARSAWTNHQQEKFRAAGVRLSQLTLVATFVGILLGAYWAHLNLGHWWTWTLPEIGGLCVLAWATILHQSFRSPHAAPQSQLILATLGNVAVALSWFGPFLLKAGHTYAMPYAALLGAFLIAQLALVYLALITRPGTLDAA